MHDDDPKRNYIFATRKYRLQHANTCLVILTLRIRKTARTVRRVPTGDAQCCELFLNIDKEETKEGNDYLSNIFNYEVKTKKTQRKIKQRMKRNTHLEEPINSSESRNEDSFVSHVLEKMSLLQSRDVIEPTKDSQFSVY